MANYTDSTKTRQGENACPTCGKLQCLCRPRFYPGQLLTEDDLNNLNQYIIEKNKLHNRYLHGWGVVCGLEVVCHPCQPGHVTVKQGYAIDPCGNDIIVCKDYDFDVIAEIGKCRRAVRKSIECDPWPQSSQTDCKDVEQTWCITLRYEEREARPVAAIRKKTTKPCGCEDDNNGSTSDCDGNGHEKKDVYAQARKRVKGREWQTVDPCEPTRICEGYRLGVLKAPKEPLADWCNNDVNTRAKELECCQKRVGDLINSAPKFLIRGNTGYPPDEAYSQCCEYISAVREFLSDAPFIHCELLHKFKQIQCPTPGTAGFSTNVIITIIKEIKRLLALYVKECECMSYLPACPPEPNDDRIILACLTIKGNEILRICHFECRRHVRGNTLSFLLRDVKSKCCSPIPTNKSIQYTPYIHVLDYSAWWVGFWLENILRSTSTSERMLTSMKSHAVFTATMPEEEKALYYDASLYIQKDTGYVTNQLSENKIIYKTVKLDDMPEEVVVLAERYLPKVLSVKEPLIVYTKGEKVVGFDIQTETKRLQHDIEKELKAKQDELATIKEDLITIKNNLNIRDR